MDFLITSWNSNFATWVNGMYIDIHMDIGCSILVILKWGCVYPLGYAKVLQGVVLSVFKMKFNRTIIIGTSVVIMLMIIIKKYLIDKILPKGYIT